MKEIVNITYRNLWFAKRYIKQNKDDVKIINLLNINSVQTFNNKERTTLDKNIQYTVNSLREFGLQFGVDVKYGVVIEFRKFEDADSEKMGLVFFLNETKISKNVTSIIKKNNNRKEKQILNTMSNLVEVKYPINPYELKSWTAKKIYEYDKMDIAEQLNLNHGLDIMICLDLVERCTDPFPTDYIFDFIEDFDIFDNIYLLNPEKNKGFISSDFPIKGAIVNKNTTSDIIKLCKDNSFDIIKVDKEERSSGYVKYKQNCIGI